ncbi:MAG: glyoxalase [Microbacterium sp.]
MTTIESVTLEVNDVPAGREFYRSVLDRDELVRVAPSDAPTTGFRGFTLSLTVGQPADVRALHERFLAAGATSLRPAEKSMWGFGGVVRAPDGTVWTLATSAKKDSGPASGEIESVVLLIGADDVGASKRFYIDRGLEVGKSFGKYVEFALPSSPIAFGLYTRKALAKVSGIPGEGTGSHRISINSAAGPFTDPDGFEWARPGAIDTTDPSDV